MRDELPKLYTLDELREVYGLGVNALLDEIADGELVAFKLGRTWRVALEDWQDFINRRRNDAARFAAFEVDLST